MSAAERQALRQVVRQRMKVLRSDVTARKAELMAEMQESLARRFNPRDKMIDDANYAIREIVDQALKDARALVEKIEKDHGLELVLNGQMGLQVSVKANDKRIMHTRLVAEIEAQVASAHVQIDRQEADLIEKITIDGLESDAAKDFLAQIPTVGQLVPTDRLAAITG